ncbi:MAG: class I SAM-dependent methyltransferase [Omnitrophica WOR_2 bacterium]
MSLTTAEWHSRFVQQARWTQSLRQYLYAGAGLENTRRVLDVGCGTGVLCAELEHAGSARIFGIDIDIDRLVLACEVAPQAAFTQANAFRLPFPDQSFDMVLCHFFLLWIREPVPVLAEMKRVTRSRGSILALAEPDYGGRIDYPSELAILGTWQQTSLREQGADPQIGRRLPSLFTRAGLELKEYGILGGQWSAAPTREEWAMEWKVLLDDLVKAKTGTGNELEKLRLLDLSAWERGERVLFIPTFYAWGQKA